MMEPTSIEVLATVIFALAVIHTFSVKFFHHLGSKYPKGSVPENLFHLLGEVEIVFGFWAGILVVAMVFMLGAQEAIAFIDGVDFTEPAFVFAIMAIASTRPLIHFCQNVIFRISNFLPFPRYARFYCTVMTLGPLLGSFITEPAAMTLTALILCNFYYEKKVSNRFRYFTLGCLFVNISIGGVLTHFAAPPVIMVAGTWGWGFEHMFTHYGWKAVIAVLVNTAIATLALKKELQSVQREQNKELKKGKVAPGWLVSLHVLFLFLVVYTAHHPKVFMGLFLFFVGVAFISREFQDRLKLRDSLLVAFFLGGLVILGSMQGWWLQPLLSSMPEIPLYLGTTILTAFTDNAALTYLGAQVEGLSESLKYYLVAGAVAGGGLSVIANAPNPAGLAILRDHLGEDGFNPFLLFKYAILPTSVALAAFGFLPTI